MKNIIENINMALFMRYVVPKANIIVQTGKISNETTIYACFPMFATPVFTNTVRQSSSIERQSIFESTTNRSKGEVLTSTQVHTI